jgi:hypothetical protein
MEQSHLVSKSDIHQSRFVDQIDVVDVQMQVEVRGVDLIQIIPPEGDGVSIEAIHKVGKVGAFFHTGVIYGVQCGREVGKV